MALDLRAVAGVAAAACVVALVADARALLRAWRQSLVLLAVFGAWFELSEVSMAFNPVIWILILLLWLGTSILAAAPVASLLGVVAGIGAAAGASRIGWGSSWRFGALLALAVTARLSDYEVDFYQHVEIGTVEMEMLQGDAISRVAPVLHAAVGALAYLAAAAAWPRRASEH
jgi:hypothetical protein